MVYLLMGGIKHQKSFWYFSFSYDFLMFFFFFLKGVVSVLAFWGGWDLNIGNVLLRYLLLLGKICLFLKNILLKKK